MRFFLFGYFLSTLLRVKLWKEWRVEAAAAEIAPFAPCPSDRYRSLSTLHLHYSFSSFAILLPFILKSHRIGWRPNLKFVRVCGFET